MLKGISELKGRENGGPSMCGGMGDAGDHVEVSGAGSDVRVYESAEA